jgi:hypothetical protein
MPEARPTNGRVAILPLPRIPAGLAGSGPDNSRSSLHVDSPYKWGLLTILGFKFEFCVPLCADMFLFFRFRNIYFCTWRDDVSVVEWCPDFYEGM